MNSQFAPSPFITRDEDTVRGRIALFIPSPGTPGEG